MVDSTAKLRQEVLALSGVDIMLDKDTFKSTYQVMDELSSKWEDLSDIAQASIIELMAGKHQGNVFASLMQNFDIAREALEVSANSAGSAMKEHAKWQESLEARLLKLKATWQSLAQSFMSSDFLKFALDGVIALIDALDKLISTLGTLPTLLSGLAIFNGIDNILTVTKGAGGLKALKDVSNILPILSKAFPKAAEGVSIFTSALAGSAGMSGLAKAATIGKGALSGLWTVVAAHPILATVAAVGLGIVAFNKWHESAEDLAEKVEEVTSKYKEQHDSLMNLKDDYNTSNENSMISRYGELSKGVNELGENISLTSSEYAEYQGIVNEIINANPDLIAGYNSQGEAILKYAGDVEKLTQAYKDLIKEQNDEVLDSGKDIFKDFSNDLKNTSAYHKTQTFDASTGTYTYKAEYDTKHFDNIERLMNLSDEELDKALSNLTVNEVSRISDLLDEYGVERNVLGSGDKGWETQRQHIIRALDEDKRKIKGVLEDAAADLNEYADNLGTVTEAYFSTAFLGGNDSDIGDYSHMSDRMQNIINQITSGFDSSFYADFLKEDNPYESLSKYYEDMLSVFDNLSNSDAKEFEAAFDLQTQFNGGKISYGEYVKGIKEAEDLINNLGLDEDVVSQIELALNTEEVTKNYETLINRLTSDKHNIKMKSSAASAFLDELNASEYAVAVDLIVNEDVDLSNFNADSLRKYIEKEAKLQDAMNFTIAIDVETESLAALNTAMAESVSGVGLSSEAIGALKGRYSELVSQGYDLSAMFEETSNGIHLNKNAVNELEQALASKKLSETEGNLEVLKGRYDELTEEIKNCTDAGKRADLYSDQQEVAQKINDLATLASQYEGLTSAYNAWQNAESAGSERDMYENVISGFETVADEIKRGWLDDGSIKFLELLTGRTDLATLSAKELKEVYNGLDDTIKHTSYSIKDFFTVDKDGNSTSQGVYNFLDAVGQLEEEKFGGKDIVKRDENGKIIGFDFNLAGGDEVIAEALGVSEELVQIMQRAADDAGFVVTLDGKWTQLADLKTSAEESEDALKKLKTNGLDALKDFDDEDLDFDFDANNLKSLNEELGKANNVLDKFRDKNGQLKKDKNGNLVDGAKDALEIASYFTATIDKLTEPVYMQLETNQVEKDLQEPLEKMQEFERLSKEKHQLELTGDTEELEKVEKEMNEIVDYIYENDDLKAKLEIEGLSKEEIKAKLEKGEIEIPATVDIQLEISDDIKDMRLMMMNQLGLISDEQLKLEIEYGVDYSAVEEYTPEQQKAIVEYFAEHDEVDNYTPEDKKALVRLIAEDNVENWSIEDIEAVVKYYVDDSDLEGWTPEEKRAFTKYIVDGGDITDYTPEDKKALAKYLVDGGDPDKYQPPSKTQNVKAELDSSEPDNYQPKDKKFTVKAILQKIGDWTNNLLSGGSKRKVVNGTANVDGTAFVGGTTGRAFKHGDWSTKDSGTALVGELGTETLVRNGKYYTIGNTGAEFIRYEKGDIIFNHKQTEELFKYGKVTSGGGRGKALVSGTAFSTGTKGGVEPEVDSYVVGTNTITGKSYTKSTDSKDDFEETIDWIETAIDRIERAIDQLDTKANSIYRTWSERNKNLVNEISNVEDEIVLQQKAYDEYIRAANAVGLSSSYASKVRNGTIDIETITDEVLKEKIDDYQTWYEKALACKDAILELKETESELYKQRFDNVASQYDGILGVIEHEKNMLEEYINQSEAQAWLVSANYYNALANNEKDNIAQLKKEKAAMLSELQTAMESGTIAKGSEAWYEMVNAIDDVTLSITESETQLKEYAQTIQQLSWETFDLLHEKISGITDETEFLVELMSNDKLFDDNGRLTDKGSATIGLHGVAYNVNMTQADKYAVEAERLEKELAKDPYDTELEERYREMISLQREHILAAEDEKEAIRDMVEEGIELELDALQERIDKYNEALDSQKNLYDYQKNVLEQTKEIASLEKQMAAYAGDTSEEAKSKIQELKVSLEDAKADLQETEYEKYISDQQQLLDELYLEYEEILNTRLDNVDALISDMIAEINTDASMISTTLSEKADSVGYALSDSMSTIWDTNSTKINSVITTYGEKFSLAQTTTNNVLNTINVNLQNMITQLNTLAKTNVKSASTSSASNSKQANATKKEEAKKPNNTTTTNATKAVTVGGMVNASGAKIYDYAGDTSGESQYYGKDPKYKVLKTDGNWIQVRWHKLSSGVTGWFKKGDVKAYKTGKRNILDSDVAWTQENGTEFIVRPSDGAILTPIAKGDSVLNAQASSNIWKLANTPADFIKDNLNLGAEVPNGSNVQNSYVQNLDNVVFNLPNVKNYDELVAMMQKDKNFEKLILSISIDRLAGKSYLAKKKIIK